MPCESGFLFHLEALAVGALHLGGVGLVGAHLDGVQTAVLGVLAVMGAVAHSALNALIRGLRHNVILLLEKSLAFRRR